MSNIQGPPANNQPPAAPDNGGRATQNSPAKQRDAKANSDDFTQALNNDSDRNGDRVKPQVLSKESGRNGDRVKAQVLSNENDRNSDRVKSQVLSNESDRNSDHVKSQVQGKEQKQPDNLEDLFRQTYSKKKETREESATIAATTEGTRTMDVQMGRTAEVQGVVDNKAMIDKIEKIADRIMVSNAADVKAVKVDFKDGVLPGTEVMIRKNDAGKLHIEFTTTSTESMNFLSRGEQALTETLNRKLGGDITIDIKMQNADSNQDTGDGRSREQYVANDDDDDNRGE